MSGDAAEAPAASERTGCCIVGAGPGGAVLALLLARRGIPVTLLEAHQDFEREFRGDTLHASVMEIMDDLGLADRLLQLPHTKVKHTVYVTGQGPVTVSDYSRLPTKYPYITVLPQARFLEFVTAEAARYPHFRLVMGASARKLVEEDGAIRGVQYRDERGWHEVRAPLTVGADGRFSSVRRLAGLEPVKVPQDMDVLWFRLPKLPGDAGDVNLVNYFGPGYYLSVIDRLDYWQVCYVIRKDSYKELRATGEAGLAMIRQAIVAMLPRFAPHVDSLRDWSQLPLLSVELGRVRRWHRPGLLLIGDAAHIMSPVAGVGINCAIHDAVVAANMLHGPLRAGAVRPRDLAAFQRRRDWRIRCLQALQRSSQKRIFARALDPSRPFTLPFYLRLRLAAYWSARLIGLGLWPVRIAK